ncbi:hypothetical protein ACET3Z_015236 [Daucus carota]
MAGLFSRYLVLALCLIICLTNISSANAAVRRFKWEVKYEYKSQDCVRKLALTINGKTPGPTIRAVRGDTIVVELNNSLLTENVAIHWHGIRQIGTPWADGTEGVTQCPILAGDTFTYKFVVDRAGTYMYHAHYGMQREAGLYGSLRVALPDGESEPFSYDYDRSIILNDWYHKSAFEQAAGLSSPQFQWVGEPDSLLIQGRGKYLCNSTTLAKDDVCNATSPECARHVIIFVPGKTYRLRIGSLTALSALSFEIEGHNMTVVEADGHYVDPFVVKNLFIYSGETYSVIVKADQDPSRNYWAVSKIVGRESNTTSGLAVINYYPNPRRDPPTIPPAGPKWNDTDARRNFSLSIKSHPKFIQSPPQTSDRVIVLLNTQNEINGIRRWSVNNVSFNLPHTPYLIALKERLGHFDQTPPPDGYDTTRYDIFKVQDNTNATSSNAIYRLKFDTVVDLILQNAQTMNKNKNDSETHPWHLHGHDFWVLGYGKGKFNKSSDPQNYNLVNPIMKNTVPVHPFGWTALRFRANNPGTWAFHCHIESHFYMGMGIVLEEGIEKVGKLPSSIMGCGDSKGYRRP